MSISSLGTLGSLRTNGGLVHGLEGVLPWHTTVVDAILLGLQIDKAIALVPLGSAS